MKGALTFTTLIIVVMVMVLTGCATLGEVPPSGAFTKGGVSLELQRKAREKGGYDKDLGAELDARFDAVVRACKAVIDVEAGHKRDANEMGLKVAIVGLIAGAIVAPTLAAANAAKSTIAAWAGLAGATNTLQNEFKARGFDPAEYAKRTDEIRAEIQKRVKAFNESQADPTRQVAEIRELSAFCMKY